MATITAETITEGPVWSDRDFTETVQFPQECYQIPAFQTGPERTPYAGSSKENSMEN